jgi:glutamate-1-semialdehyde aminotransferase
MASDREAAATFNLGLVANGVYLTPYHLAFTNGAQSSEDIETVLDVAERVLTQMRHRW